MEVGETEVETIPDLNLGFSTMTPKKSQDTELVEGEPQQQENVESDQGVVTQEITSSGIITETPIQLGTIDLEVEIIPDSELREDEHMQSQPSGGTEVFKD